MRSAVALRALAPAERRVLILAGVLLPLTTLALRRLGWRRSQGALARWPRSRAASSLVDVDTIARLVRLAAERGVGRPSCLAKALVLWTLLRRAGLDAALRIGVRPRNGALDAHAWVEHAGRRLGEDPGVLERFSAFAAAFGGSGPR